MLKHNEEGCNAPQGLYAVKMKLVKIWLMVFHIISRFLFSGVPARGRKFLIAVCSQMLRSFFAASDLFC